MPRPQLTKGGRALVAQLQADVAAARVELDAAADWNKKREPIDVARHLRAAHDELDALTRRIRDELEPMLQRREDNAARAVDDRLAALESDVAALKAQLAGSAPAQSFRVLKQGEGEGARHIGADGRS